MVWPFQNSSWSKFQFSSFKFPVSTFKSLLPLIFLLGALLSGTAAAFTNVVPNPSIEIDADKDNVPNDWRKEATGEAVAALETNAKVPDGSRAVSLQGKSTWICTVPGIIPSRTYLLSLWLMRHGWRDGEYPTVRIFDHVLYLNELFFSGGWVHVSRLLTAPAGPETTLSLVNPGLTHRIWFDTLSFSEFQVFLRSPKEGALMDASQPVFFWSLPEDRRVYDLSLEVFRSRDFSNPLRLETVSPWGNTALLDKQSAQGEEPRIGNSKRVIRNQRES